MTRLYCAPCDSFTPRTDVWNLSEPLCPECCGELREVEPPQVMVSAYLTGEAEFVAAIPARPDAVATYSEGCLFARQAGGL